MKGNPKRRFLETGTLLDGKWEILEHIATGGKGEIYRAKQVNLDREVAIKVISPEFLEMFEDDEEETLLELERFAREVKSMAQARHPNVVQVYDYGRVTVQTEGREFTTEYLAMEYVPGETLRERMPEQGFGSDEDALKSWIRSFFIPVLEGVAAIHGLGIIHRDLKPENVLLDGETPKITDFGLAGGPRWAQQQKLTQSYHFMGTVPYMSREHMLDMDSMDERGDVYALGKILYEAVVGRMGKDNTFPFQTVSLPGPGTPFLKGLSSIIQRATAEDREKRLATTGELKKELLSHLGEQEAAAKPFPSRLILGGLAALVLLSLGVHVFYHNVIKTRPGPSGEPPASLTSPPAAEEKKPLSAVITGADGARLRLIEPGEDRGAKAGIASFYLDETEVTNHQFVGFLNSIPDRVRVEKGAVLGDGDLWLVLGKMKDGLEPIVFRDGRFVINDPTLHSHPVVRVTGWGARAFARFYKRRLPTDGELFLAAKGESGLAAAPASDSMLTMHQMHTSFPPATDEVGPVAQGRANDYGVKGLAGNVSEWVLMAGPEGEGPEFGVLEVDTAGAGLKASFRQPLEVSESVGFRCAKTP